MERAVFYQTESNLFITDDERSSKKKRKNEASPFTNAGYGGQFDYTKQFHASSSSADDYESKVGQIWVHSKNKNLLLQCLAGS